MPTAPSALDARYGRTPERRRRSRLVGAVAIGALAVAAVAWALWTGIGGSTGTLDIETVATTVNGEDSTTVRWLVVGRADTELVCAVEARDGAGVAVGLVEQVVPATGSADRAGDTVVRTVREATSGLIVSCRAA